MDQEARFHLRYEARDIWRVWLDDECVGTILFYTTGPQHFWMWSVTGIVPRNGGSVMTSGRADSREEAMAQFRSSWTRVLAVPHVEVERLTIDQADA
jgi:hypothetical protein